jgi:hypothetical protein
MKLLIKEEQVEVGEDVWETFKRDVDQIEMDLEINILMIKDQENVVHVTPLPKQKNVYEDVETHAHIDVGDITIEQHLL